MIGIDEAVDEDACRVRATRSTSVERRSGTRPFPAVFLSWRVTFILPPAPFCAISRAAGSERLMASASIPEVGGRFSMCRLFDGRWRRSWNNDFFDYLFHQWGRRREPRGDHRLEGPVHVDRR